MEREVSANLYYYYASGILILVISTILAFRFATQQKFILPKNILYTLLICSGYMFLVQLFKFNSLHFYTDFAHWGQVIHSIANTGKPHTIAHELHRPGTLNYFSMHFTPLVYLIALFYKIIPYPETIIFLNNIFMISSIIPLYKLANKLIDNKKLSLFICVLLLWYPSFQYIVTYEFEMLRFSIPIIFWMLYFLESKNLLLYYVFVLLAILVREEVGLTIAVFSLYLFFFQKNRKVALTTFVLGLSGSMIILQVIMPSLNSSINTENIAMTKIYPAFGETNGEIIKNIIFNPVFTLSVIFQKIKIANVVMMFIPLLFIPLLSLPSLIGSFAQFGILLLTNSITNISYMLYYVSPTIPFIFYAFIKSWPKVIKILESFCNNKYDKFQLNNALMISILVGLLSSNVFFGSSPLSLQFWFKDIRPAPFNTQNHHYSTYIINDHHLLIDDFIDIIPEASIVAASQHLQPHLIKKKGTIFLNEHSENPEYLANYVFFDKTNNKIGLNSPAFITESHWGIFEKEKKHWELIKTQDGLFLYKRKLLID